MFWQDISDSQGGFLVFLLILGCLSCFWSASLGESLISFFSFHLCDDFYFILWRYVLYYLYYDAKDLVFTFLVLIFRGCSGRWYRWLIWSFFFFSQVVGLVFCFHDLIKIAVIVRLRGFNSAWMIFRRLERSLACTSYHCFFCCCIPRAAKVVLFGV